MATGSVRSSNSGLTALCPHEVLHESPYDRGHRESVLRAPFFERGVRFLWQSNGERLMLAARWNDRHRRRHQLWCGYREATNGRLQGPRWLDMTEPEVEPGSEQVSENDRPVPLGKSVEGLLDESSHPLAL